MMTNPDNAISDLNKYLAKFEISLSKNAEKLFRCAEEVSFKYNANINYYGYLFCALKNIKTFALLINQSGGNSIRGIEVVEQTIKEENSSGYNPYDASSYLYSGLDSREISTRTQIVDLCISAANRSQRKHITEYDLIEALLQFHDQVVPATENKQWVDERLRTPYNTLSHMAGRYTPSLWIKLDDVRRHFGFADPISLQKMPVESAPIHIRSAILSLLHDFPDFQQNVFLIMPFDSTPMHDRIHQSLKSCLKTHGYNLLRADDRTYSDDLLRNIEAYIYGTRFAIAVYERITNDSHNPNVSFEVGYCQGLKKSVCILKERTVKVLHTDLSGRLYVEFDAQDIDATIHTSVERWMRDKAFI